MNAHRMDSETVERLLDGTAVDLQDGRHPLVPLLSAVRAAPDPGELAGEAAAVRAYQMALLGSPLTVPAVRRRGFALTGLGLRAALAGLLVAGTGGVALAATGGVLPNPLRPPTASTAPSPSTPTPAGSPTGGTGPGSVPPAGTERPDPAGSVAGLCEAYRAEVQENPGRALDNPVFGDLVGAAGGRDQVPGYCDRVLGGKTGRPDPRTTPTGRPGTPPTVRPTDRATQPPTPPTGRPDAPSGQDPRTSPPPGGSRSAKA